MRASMAEHGQDASARWLSVVGIGEDGLAGLSDAARATIATAQTVFGGPRHLELAQTAITGEAKSWPVPFDAAMQAVTALRGRRVCVLASGDPFWHGVGGTLARHVPADEMNVFPSPSSFSLAAARLGWALQDVETISLHGRPIERLRPLLQDGTHILALTSDGAAPAAIARMMTEHGFGGSQLQVLEALGGPSERIAALEASAIGERAFDPLNLLAITVVAGAEAQEIPLAGVEDAQFEHDGQITKQDVRALTLAALRPKRGQLLWDIGAGSGSIGIGWMLTHPSLRAIAIEADTARASRITRNAGALGTPELRVVEGEAPAALDGLPAPDAIFVGGGGSEAGVMAAALTALKPGGRLVANAVTLEMEAVLLDLHGRHGGTLARLSLAQAAPVGTMQGWRPAMPLTRWTWVKPR